jgi:hypothetical protein
MPNVLHSSIAEKYQTQQQPNAGTPMNHQSSSNQLMQQQQAMQAQHQQQQLQQQQMQQMQQHMANMSMGSPAHRLQS